MTSVGDATDAAVDNDEVIRGLLSSLDGGTIDDTASTARRMPEPSFPWWFRALLSSFAVAAVAAYALRQPISDPDTFWQIRSGQWLTETWQFVGPEPWSQSSSRPWILHEWLPELLIGRVESAFGLRGVSWLYAIGVCLVALCVWVACRRRAVSIVAGLLVGVTLFAMLGSLTPRPHLVTFALSVVFVDTWLRSVQDGKSRWWLILASWLWACSHGMWFLGPAIGALVLVGATLDRTLSRERLVRLGTVWLGTAVVGAATPIGPRLFLAPFHVGEYTRFVTEWRPATLTSPHLVIVLSIAAVVVVVWARQRQRVSWTHILVVGLGVGLALMYARTVAVGAAVLAPIAATTIQGVLPVRRDTLTRKESAVALSLVAVAMVAAAIVSPGQLGQQGLGPDSLASRLDALPSGSVVCNDYGLGGWLLWRFPALHPVIDGRAEVYSVDHLEGYVNFVAGGPGWEDFPVRNDCTAALLADDEPVIEDLVEAGWTTVASAGGYALLETSD